MKIANKLQELGIVLPEAPQRAGVYAPVKEFGQNLAFVSGCLPIVAGEAITGKLGADCSLEDGRKAAERCVLNILALLQQQLGDLDRIKRCVKMTVFVAGTPDFHQHPQVANAATELLVQVFGEEVGCPSRSAFGVSALPLNVAVEVELLVEVT